MTVSKATTSPSVHVHPVQRREWQKYPPEKRFIRDIHNGPVVQRTYYVSDDTESPDVLPQGNRT